MNQKKKERHLQLSGQDLMGQLFDRLTWKGSGSISTVLETWRDRFPKGAGPQGQTLGSAKWVING